VAPDGAGVLYERDGDHAVMQITLGDLTTQPVVTLADTPGGDVLFLDLDDGVAVEQIGGDGNDPQTVAGQGNLRCVSQQGAGSIIAQAAPLIGRGPKVAHVVSEFTLAFTQIDAGTNQPETRFCALTCNATPSCTNPKDAAPIGAIDLSVDIARDGRIGILTVVDGLSQVAVFNTLGRRRTTLTTDLNERTALRMAVNRIVWSDASLGSTAVFEASLP
jgi:hypothetical protein